MSECNSSRNSVVVEITTTLAIVGKRTLEENSGTEIRTTYQN